MGKITFGLTGGIACGKSAVTKTFRAHNIPMVDADILARQVVEVGTPGLEQVIKCFGSQYLQADGTLDRTALGKLVFSKLEARRQVESIMSPLIQAEADKQIEELHQQGHEKVGYDAALICEMGIADKYRPLIVVSCPALTQLERLMSRNSLTEAEGLARINAQMANDKKIAMADFVIDTSGTIENSIEQTKRIMFRLHGMLLQQKLDNGEIKYHQVPYPYRDCAGNDSPDE
jgi:dephospho-CoA kinase